MNVPRLRFKEFSGEWKQKKLGDVTNKITDGTHDTPKPIPEGIPYLTAIHIKDGNIDYDNCYFLSEEEHKKIYKRCNPEKGDLLIVNIGAGTATCAINIVDYEFSLKNVALIKPNKELIYPEYLVQIQRKNGLKQFNQLTSGGAQPFLSLNEIGKIKVSFPSLPEQTKIANFLTAVDKKITQLTQKSDLLARYKRGVMQQIFSQQLRFKDDDGREFPDWEVKSLGDVAKFRRGSFPQPYGLAKWYDDINGMPFIQVFDVDDNFRLKDKTKRKISKKAQLQSVFVEKGSILITIQGSIGRIAITQYDAYVDRTLLLFESFKVKINKYYFAYVLFLLFEIEKEKAPGGIIKTITKEVLTDFNVFICDYAEQTKIANFLTALDDKITHNQTQLNALKHYKQGLLQQLFV